ncbi:DUF2637 domain-containing protein [Streptomyces sp. NPDC021098]|uniref:DUF2637 domain-containing protein n=1 Tax=unclassified Streptomyces TaxID=2593676 RepID=UPI00378BF884
MTAWDGTAIVLLGSAGFAFSYDALRQIAVAIHARETLSYLFPVFIDGFIAYGVRAIVLLRNRHFGARLYAWALFLVATGASLGANALHAVTLNHGPRTERSALHLTDSVVGVLSMLAPLALAGSVHLYILMARTAERAVRDQADSSSGPSTETFDHTTTLPFGRRQSLLRGRWGRQGPQRDEVRPSAADDAAGTGVDLCKHNGGPTGTGIVAPSQEPGAAPSPSGADRSDERDDQPDGQLAPAADHEAAASLSTGTTATTTDLARTPADEEKPSVPDGVESTGAREADVAWLDELLPIARAASRRAGRISRDTVKAAVRAHQPIGNDRLGILLARLKDEEDTAAQEPSGASGGLQ